jgi:hypothetical protein
MRLRENVIAAVKKAGVSVYFVDRRITKIWNTDRDREDPTHFGGWYWNRTERGRVVETDKEGPFRSEMAAYRDAYVKLQLRPDSPKTPMKQKA